MAQRWFSAAAAAMADYEKRKARERQIELAGTRKDDLPPTSVEGTEKKDSGEAAVRLGAKVGVGKTLIRQAIKVREKGVPELNTAVAEGKITVNEAERTATV